MIPYFLFIGSPALTLEDREAMDGSTFFVVMFHPSEPRTAVAPVTN
jgi:hypothetical protein